MHPKEGFQSPVRQADVSRGELASLLSPGVPIQRWSLCIGPNLGVLLTKASATAECPLCQQHRQMLSAQYGVIPCRD